MSFAVAVALCFSVLKTVLGANNTGVPQIPFTAPSSQHHSSTSGITHMSPDREELILFRDLFDGYDKRLRPALRKEDNVTVILGISVHQLIDIDERNELMRLSVWVRRFSPPNPLPWHLSARSMVFACGFTMPFKLP